MATISILTTTPASTRNMANFTNEFEIKLISAFFENPKEKSNIKFNQDSIEALSFLIGTAFSELLIRNKKTLSSHVFVDSEHKYDANYLANHLELIRDFPNNHIYAKIKEIQTIRALKKLTGLVEFLKFDKENTAQIIF